MSTTKAVEQFAKRSSPAVRRFPILQAIQPGFKPRKSPIPTPAASDKTRRAYLRSLYHDMGALVFSGAVTTQQVDRLGGVLQDVIKPSLRFSSKPQHTGDPEFDKFVVYRFPTEERHVDKKFKPKRGYLTSKGLLDIGTKAAQRWIKEIQENSKHIETLGHNIGFMDVEMTMFFDAVARGGVIHQTVDGPRLLPVEVFVSATRSSKIRLRIQVFTVGTRKHVGTINMNIVPYSKKNISPRAPFDEWNARVDEMYKFAPSEEASDVELLRSTTSSFYKLEHEVWRALKVADSKAKAEAQKAESGAEELKGQAEAGPDSQPEKTGEVEAQPEKTEEAEAQPEKAEAAADAQPEIKSADTEASVVDEALKAEAESRATSQEVGQAPIPEQNSTEPPTKS